ncbi:hypothetical protein KBZ21_45185, partial [Streptomyces sp. A73]|nr:hypothetical protein [Streptomyces sp. A73]
ADVSFRQPSPFRPPDANDSEQLSFAAHPDVFGSTLSAVADRRVPGIAMSPPRPRTQRRQQLAIATAYLGTRDIGDLT